MSSFIKGFGKGLLIALGLILFLSLLFALSGGNMDVAGRILILSVGSLALYAGYKEAKSKKNE